MNTKRLLKNIQALVNESLQVKAVHDDEYTNLELYKSGKRLAYISFREIQYGYYIFEDDMEEDEYNELFPDDEFAYLETLHVEPEHRGKGYARKLIGEALKYIRSKGLRQVYLNASPSYDSSLALPDLVNLYKSFGFKELSGYAGNVEMLLDL